MNRWILFVLAGLITGCPAKKTQEATSGTAPSAQMDSYTPTEEEQAQIRDNVARGLLGDSTMFPYVYQGEGRNLIYQAYSMSFTLETQMALSAMMNQNVQWVKPDANNEKNGVFATYVRNGRELSLENPYIQVQYISKTLPYCSTLDSVFLWMDQNFLKNPAAEILQKRTPIQTASGKTAFYKSYTTGSNPNPAYRQKWISNGYIDYDDDYFIAFGLTTMDEGDFELTKPIFDDLVESFQEY